MKRKQIHQSIKEALGYDSNTSDTEFMKNWKLRSTQVCKPCWELKYCPYGPFVEQSPLIPQERESASEHHNYLKTCVESGLYGTIGPIDPERKEYLVELISLAEDHFPAFAMVVSRHFYNKVEVEDASKEGKNLAEVWAKSLPSIEKYRVPFSLIEPSDDDSKLPEPEDLSPEMISFAKELLEKYKTTVATGIEDDRKRLEPARRMAFELMIERFNPEDYPEHIPPEVSDMQCSIFGHICPVVFVGESITETSEKRRRGRYIPFAVKMRVVRRDNYTCRVCNKHLQDNEVEFDHEIPLAKGGSSEEHNIRLTCFDCNREKSDDVRI